VNYFEHHIGDYDKNTSHLTACEDGIYHRMLRRYYDKERPLPGDSNEIKRLVRARVPAERKAVDDVLAEFFHLENDGWHHDVCDAALADYLAGEPEREVKKANEDNRLRRHREERARLFKVITGAGEHAPWNTPMSDLRQLVERLSGNAPATPKPRSPETQPATAPATPATATQSPLPIHQSPITIDSERESAKRATRKPPADFAVTDDLRDWAAQKARGVDLQVETEKFRDHTFKTAISDWPGAWRNWIRRCATPAPGRTQQPAEPAWRTEQRERVQQAAPYVAARPRAAAPATETFDAEDWNRGLPTP
jgi:uncharacterized protein YdaU (DUF1376 family)